MKIKFDNLVCEEDATYYSNVVYKIPESIQVDGCTHILESYYGDDTLDEVSIGALVPNSNNRSTVPLEFIRRYYINFESLLWDSGGHVVIGIDWRGEDSLSETNPY